MTGNPKLNGSVDLLAQAMRSVFSEAVQGAVEPLAEQVKAVRTDVSELRSDMNKQIKTTNENMQSQFAQQEKKIGQLIAKRQPVGT